MWSERNRACFLMVLLGHMEPRSLGAARIMPANSSASRVPTSCLWLSTPKGSFSFRMSQPLPTLRLRRFYLLSACIAGAANSVVLGKPQFSWLHAAAGALVVCGSVAEAQDKRFFLWSKQAPAKGRAVPKPNFCCQELLFQNGRRRSEKFRNLNKQKREKRKVLEQATPEE